ncbi:hypothetical protein MTR67_050891 [Solanum verrucosum]|uniref:Cytochrome P450 n=1 Tax=Solanum verrucosum TaxID=315347 RepID=A0AAF0V6B1_SOLVR|nr:hypothetical protein MTR67_050891 [Solanum verrucosum]
MPKVTVPSSNVYSSSDRSHFRVPATGVDQQQHATAASQPAGSRNTAATSVDQQHAAAASRPAVSRPFQFPHSQALTTDLFPLPVTTIRDLLYAKKLEVLSMVLIWATVVVIFIVYAFYELLNNIHNRKRYPPGPKGLPIIGHLHLLGKNPHQDFLKLAKTHGPLMYVRLGLVPTIVVSSADTVEKFLKTYDHIFATRPHNEAAYYLAYGQRNMISEKHGPYMLL